MPLEDEAQLRKQLVSGAKWATGVRIASQAFTWSVTLIMVRLLTPQDYGLNAMIEVPIELLFLFSTLGLDAAIIRFGRRDPAQLSSTFGLLLAVNGALFLALLLCANLIAEYFKEPRLALLIQVSALSFVLAPFRTIPNALLDMALEFKIKAQVELAAAIISSLIALAMALAGAGVWALVTTMLMSAFLRAALLAYFRPWILRPRFDIGPVMELLKYGLVIMSGEAIRVFSGSALSLLAGPIIGAKVLGLYAVARVFSTLPMSKIMPILQQTMFPAFARLKEQPDVAKKYLLKSLELSSLIIFPVTIGMACVSEHLVNVVFGEKWKTIAVPLAILSALMPVRLINQIFYAPLNALGHAKWVTMINLLSLAIIAIGAVSAAKFGLLGLVYLSSLSAILSTIFSIYIGKKMLDTSVADLCRALKPAFSGTLVMAIILLVANQFIFVQSGLIWLTIEIVCGGLIYYMMMFFLFRKTLDEVQNHIF
jgi:O-antigen/teichoic acid export membrane protein